MHSFEDILRLYDYEFPPDRIAQAPASPRDSAKLLIYHRKSGQVHRSSVRHLDDFLPPKSVLVLNETKVIPARLHLTKATGGKVSMLILGHEKGMVRALANKPLREGEILCVCRRTGANAGVPAGRPYKGVYECMVMRRSGKEWILRPSFPIADLPSILERHGVMPLPPYIKHSPLTEAEIKKRYQTVFARTSGSIAAPTASLHFTKGLLTRLEKKGITIARVTLHVHLGTFAPLTEQQWKTGKLHPEFYSIDSKTARLITAAKRKGRPVIAAGTTVARTLESASDTRGTILYPRGVTRLFIRPSSGLRASYRFRMIDGLLTNFHVPKSSLLMLVAALAGREKILELYQDAIEHDFRLFSFGDAMLIL